MKVLRPVPTFEQVARIPDPVINLPDRVIEVSRPDPNLWDEHEDAVRARSVMVARLRDRNHETREAAHSNGCFYRRYPVCDDQRCKHGAFRGNGGCNVGHI